VLVSIGLQRCNQNLALRVSEGVEAERGEASRPALRLPLAARIPKSSGPPCLIYEMASRPDLGLEAGFFDFSHWRLFPLEYRLPARFETIPSRPSSQALANTSGEA
jgi:hypothetical protein